MKYGTDFLKDISEKIIKKEMVYGDTIIIGENSSGKSLLLYLLIKNAGDSDAVYFVDAVNRNFDVTKVIQGEKKPKYLRTVVDTRIKEEYFNLKDSFNCFGTLTERVEQIYVPFENEVQELFGQLTKEQFRLIQGGSLGEVEFEGRRGLLSSGYQAIVRILLELLYYQERCIEEKGLEEAFVIIDELDECLSPGYCSKIFGFLKEKFPKMRLVVTTHSCDLVAGISDANLVILHESGYEVVDINDYQSVSEVQIIFGRVFGTDKLIECIPNIGIACPVCNQSFKRIGEKKRRVPASVRKVFEKNSRCLVNQRKQCTVPCRALRGLQSAYSQRPEAGIILQPIGIKGRNNLHQSSYPTFPSK